MSITKSQTSTSFFTSPRKAAGFTGARPHCYQLLDVIEVCFLSYQLRGDRIKGNEATGVPDLFSLPPLFKALLVLSPKSSLNLFAAANSRLSRNEQSFLN